MANDLVTVTAADILPPAAAEPMGPVSELARALHLVMPSVRDPENTANCIAMMLAKRNVFLVREGVPFQ